MHWHACTHMHLLTPHITFIPTYSCHTCTRACGLTHPPGPIAGNSPQVSGWRPPCLLGQLTSTPLHGSSAHSLQAGAHLPLPTMEPGSWHVLFPRLACLCLCLPLRLSSSFKTLQEISPQEASLISRLDWKPPHWPPECPPGMDHHTVSLGCGLLRAGRVSVPLLGRAQLTTHSRSSAKTWRDTGQYGGKVGAL